MIKSILYNNLVSDGLFMLSHIDNFVTFIYVEPH